MISPDVLQYLKDNLYIISKTDGFIISNKFIRELGGNTFSPAIVPIVKSSLIVLSTAKDHYKQFIQDAEIPSKITTNSGSFWANRFSEPGFKAFKKVWEDSKIDNKILLAATKWYYKQTNTARKMVGNYFSEGIWESCYDDFVRAMKNKTSVPITINQDKEGGNSLRL